MSQEALDLDQQIVDEFQEEIEKIPMEEKVVAMYEEQSENYLSPLQLDNLVQEAVDQLPEDLTSDQLAEITEIIRDLVLSMHGE